MASHEAAHINHARRPPAQTEFGSAFFIPFPGLQYHVYKNRSTFFGDFRFNY